MPREYTVAAAPSEPPRDETEARARHPSASLSLFTGDGLGWSAGGAGAASMLVATIERLERIVGGETELLRQHKVVDLRDFNHRKSQGLLELSRAMRALAPGTPDNGVRAALARLRARLDENLVVLRLHLAAAQEVAALISRVIREAESDGTYGTSVASRE